MRSCRFNPVLALFLLLLVLFACPQGVSAEQVEPYGPQVGDGDITRILNCMHKTGDNENWLGWIMYYGMAGCLRPGAEEPDSLGAPAAEAASGIPFYLDMPEEGVPYPNYYSDTYFYYNPAMLEWLDVQFETILNSPPLRMLGESIYAQQRQVARSVVFAHECLKRNGSFEGFANQLHIELLNGSEDAFTDELTDMCAGYYDGTFDTATEYATNRVKWGTWFWLRRTMDGTADTVWAMLAKGMEAYDPIWFDTRGVREPGGTMRGGYEYLLLYDEADDAEHDEDSEEYAEGDEGYEKEYEEGEEEYNPNDYPDEPDEAKW